VLEEQGCPGDEGGGKAQEAEGVEEVGRVDVVEEALYVKKYGRGDVTIGDSGLGKVSEVGSTINSRAVIPTAKLEGAEEGE
jgi:hypothetical protein